MTKDERVWNDPVLSDPKLSDASLWRIEFVGGINILMGILLYVIINYSDAPVGAIPGVFLCVGGAFFVFGGCLWLYKSKKAKQI
jgi:hypothetical protein